MAFSRRKFLIGVGGAVVGLPFLEGLAPKTAHADNSVAPFVIFYRRANGVQQAINDRNDYLPENAGSREPERWWPMQADGVTPIPYGPISTLGPISAMNELETYVSKMGIPRGLRHPYGTENGHPEAHVQGLTGAGVKYANDVPDFLNCSPLGESLDNRIARELSAGAISESLFMGVRTGNEGGVSWLKQGNSLFPRAAQENLFNIYNELFLPLAGDQASRDLLIERRKSINDLVRGDLTALKNDPRLSAADRDRLALHMDAIRDTELAITACTVPGTLLGEVQGYDAASITAKINVIGKLAALAVACGVRRSVYVTVGVPQDILNYTEVAGAGSYEFHALSHRQSSETNMNPFAAARDLHHAIDRYHLKRFKSIVDQLAAYDVGGGQKLIDKGTCVHFSDLGSGAHIVTRLPYFYVGGASGALKTGVYVDANAEHPNAAYLVRFLNTIGAAVGCKNAAGGPLDDFNADNNNYRSKNYAYCYYDTPSPPEPADGKPAITGRIAGLVA